MLLNVNPGLIFWTVVTFLILLLVLKKFAWRPILGALEEREKRIKESLDKAEEAKVEAERLIAEQKQMLDMAKKEAQEIVNRSRKSAETAQEEILQKAKSEANQMVEKAKREINLSRDKALEEIRDYAVELSIAATTKAIRKALTPEDHLHLIDESIKEMRPTL